MTNNHSQSVIEFITFYNAMGRSPSLLEIFTRAPNVSSESLSIVTETLDNIVEKKVIFEKNGFFALAENKDIVETRAAQDFLYDMKWKNMARKTKLFRFLPFVDFALLSGSMSFGAVKKTSDFDVVLGMRHDRMFLARYLIGALFSLFRARRLDDLEESSPNKFCFNHIITDRIYEKPPHNYYRYELYRHMIPIYIGNSGAYRSFEEKNMWANINQLNATMNVEYGKNRCALFFEKIFGGTFGDFIEFHIARPIAKQRLSHYIKEKGNDKHLSRVIVNDSELEFHFILNYEEQFKNFQI